METIPLHKRSRTQGDKQAAHVSLGPPAVMAVYNLYKRSRTQGDKQAAHVLLGPPAVMAVYNLHKRSRTQGDKQAAHVSLGPPEVMTVYKKIKLTLTVLFCKIGIDIENLGRTIILTTGYSSNDTDAGKW